MWHCDIQTDSIEFFQQMASTDRDSILLSFFTFFYSQCWHNYLHFGNKINSKPDCLRKNKIQLQTIPFGNDNCCERNKNKIFYSIIYTLATPFGVSKAKSFVTSSIFLLRSIVCSVFYFFRTKFVVSNYPYFFSLLFIALFYCILYQ